MKTKCLHVGGSQGSWSAPRSALLPSSRPPPCRAGRPDHSRRRAVGPPSTQGHARPGAREPLLAPHPERHTEKKHLKIQAVIQSPAIGDQPNGPPSQRPGPTPHRRPDTTAKRMSTSIGGAIRIVRKLSAATGGTQCWAGRIVIPTSQLLTNSISHYKHSTTTANDGRFW
eukprot:scaffold211916_cov31-Tisochrysis_lutea.AAC.5